jgi:hypothetical protein
MGFKRDLAGTSTVGFRNTTARKSYVVCIPPMAGSLALGISRKVARKVVMGFMSTLAGRCILVFKASMARILPLVNKIRVAGQQHFSVSPLRRA